jgi:hypothetical protein
MSRVVTVLVEWRGVDRPARITRGNRSWEQWLRQDTIDEMGMRRMCAFRAEHVDGTWFIGPRCDDRQRQTIG